MFPERLEIRPEARARLERLGLARLEDLLDAPRGEVVKDALVGRVTIRIADPEGGGVFVKRRLRSAAPWLGRRSGTAREVAALRRLEDLGLPAPRLLAWGERRRLGGPDEGVVVLEALPEGRSLEALVIDPGEPSGGSKALARALGRLVRRLHDAGVAHRDLYANHVHVSADGGLHLLDFDRALIRRRLRRRWRVKDLASLHFSLPERLVDPGTRLVFLRAYLGCLGPAATALANRVERKARIVRAHVRRRIAAGRPNFHENL